MPPTSASPADFAFCPHDRGPGISVCLRCRADAHRKAALGRRRVATQAGIGTMVLLVLAVAATNSGTARGASSHARPPAAPADSVTARSETFRVVQSGAVAASVARAPRATLEPAIPSGRTDLMSGTYADRTGDSLVVHFDTPLLRTRRRDKFEQVVRTTLPAVFGAYGDSVIAAIPAGEIASTGDLLAELPARGVRLPAHNGWALTVWPLTRPGQDGPLVVAYRVTSARAE